MSLVELLVVVFFIAVFVGWAVSLAVGALMIKKWWK